jgi:hypothetical protein
MSTNKPKGKSKELYFATYKSSKKQESNRLLKLLRLQKQQPNNTQIALAIKDIHYRRGTPKVPVWSHNMISEAKVMKYFLGKFDKGLFSSDPKIVAAAQHTRNENIFSNNKPLNFNQNSMFSIKERAHSLNGMRVWI